MSVDNNLGNGCLHCCNRIVDYNYDVRELEELIKDGKVEKNTGNLIFDIDKFKKNSEAVIAKKGSVLFFDPLCPHFSDVNKSADVRRNLYLTVCNDVPGVDLYNLFLSDKDLLLKKIGQEKLDKRSSAR